MAKKTLTPAEIKSAKKDIQTLLKQQKEALKPFQSDASAADKALGVAKKQAAKMIAEAEKAANAARAKLQKAESAAAKGAEKLNAKLAALEPAVSGTTAAA